MTNSGLKPHTHADRTAMIEQLIPLWQEKFGKNLLGIGASASYARGEDAAYSDLELDLFLEDLPAGEDAYYQRVVDGLLIEAIYHTPEAFLRERISLAPHWFISASDRLLPVYHAPFVEKLADQARQTNFAEDDFLKVAAHKRYELQESFAKVLNAVEQNNAEGVSLLVMDAALTLLQMLALINHKPFTTFSRFIPQARQFTIKPERFDALLDILVQGTYQDLPRVGEVMAAVFRSMQQFFDSKGIQLYEDPLDPRLPNTPFEKETGIRLVPVNRDNAEACIKLPIGEDHRSNVAPNIVSIAYAQFDPGSHSCCIYAGDVLVGYTWYGLQYDLKSQTPLMWVSRLMIAEDQRGQGYGRGALSLIIAEARRLGVHRVSLSTHPDNFKAIGLYESLGFRATEIEDKEMVYILQI